MVKNISWHSDSTLKVLNCSHIIDAGLEKNVMAGTGVLQYFRSWHNMRFQPCKLVGPWRWDYIASYKSWPLANYVSKCHILIRVSTVHFKLEPHLVNIFLKSHVLLGWASPHPYIKEWRECCSRMLTEIQKGWSLHISYPWECTQL